MTNGDKFQQIFAVSQVDECDLNVYAWLLSHDAIEIPLEWWNANYSEIPTGSTTKNDLGVDAVSRQAVIDLMMQKWGENFSGDDAMQESIDAIRVMPSVTPQEPITWIAGKNNAQIAVKNMPIDKLQKICAIIGDEQEPILDKIRAEIIKYEGDCRLSVDEYPSCKQCTDNVFETIYGIIDKYKAESEET